MPETPAPPKRPRGLKRATPPAPVVDEGVPDDEGEPELSGFRLPLLDKLDELEPLSARERSKPQRVRLAHALQRWGMVLDEGIPLLSRDGADAVIWGDLDDEDAAILADALMTVGERNKIVAQATRGILASYELVDAGLITGRRFAKMVRYYVRHGIAINFRVMWGRVRG